MDIVKRATYIFDEVIIAVAKSESMKSPMFSTRTKGSSLPKQLHKDMPKVKVIGFDTLIS